MAKFLYDINSRQKQIYLGEIMQKGKAEKNNQLHNFITYFQSVTTIGIVSRAKTKDEARKESEQKFKGEKFTCGIVSQTKYKENITEEWKPQMI